MKFILLCCPKQKWCNQISHNQFLYYYTPNDTTCDRDIAEVWCSQFIAAYGTYQNHWHVEGRVKWVSHTFAVIMFVFSVNSEFCHLSMNSTEAFMKLLGEKKHLVRLFQSEL